MSSMTKQGLDSSKQIQRNQPARILQDQSELGPDDFAHPKMLAWCQRAGEHVVLNNGQILTCQPDSQSLQNCQLQMQQHQITLGTIKLASSDLIQTLLDNTPLANVHVQSTESMSQQQARLRRLLREALSLNATDIHLEVRQDDAKIRFRRQGELLPHATWHRHIAEELIAVAFNKETDQNDRHFNPRLPQNAAMPLQLDTQAIRLRLASVPAQSGYDVVMRILPDTAEEVASLAALGYLPQQQQQLRNIIAQPQGAVFISGPTGSGKTTCMASCMQHIHPSRKIYTIEDPVEKRIPNATQIPVSSQFSDLDFASMMHTALRMDPNVIVLGEVRDAKTAQCVMSAALTGHLVLSTVHTHSAVDIIARLQDLGVSNRLLAGEKTILALISQRLLPTLCTECSEPLNQQDPHFTQLKNHYGDAVSGLRQRGQGCQACQHQGIHGRTVAAEILGIDRFAADCIRQNDAGQWREYLQSSPWQSLRDVADLHVKAGTCDVHDVRRILGFNSFTEAA